MAINKPGFKPNVQASLENLKAKSKFLDFTPNSRTLIRFLPTALEDGSLFYKVVQHFKLKNQDGRGIALACLEEHGTDETGRKCWLCDLNDKLEKGDRAQTKLAKELRAAPRFYAQVIKAEQKGDKFLWSGPMLAAFSPKTAKMILDQLNGLELVDAADFTDEKEGRGVFIVRSGSGFDTTYTVGLDPRGPEPLDAIFPGWVESFIHDYAAFLDLKIVSRDLQREYTTLTFGEDALGLNELGL